MCFIENFQELPQNVQMLIIEKLYGNMKTWCIQHKLLIIDASKLIKLVSHPKLFIQHIMLLNY